MELLIEYYIVLGVWLLLALIMGGIEAILFHKWWDLADTVEKETSVDIHTIFTGVRCLLATVLLTIMTKDGQNTGLLQYIGENRILIAVQMVLMFPFLHDGFYYWLRNKMNKKAYPKGWWDKSHETTAVFSINAWWRLWLFLFGVMMTPF